MSIFSGPDSPDPGQTANAQQSYNQNAAASQARINMVDQNTPFGTLKYSQTGVGPDGTPTFAANTSYTPEVQDLITKQLQSGTVDPSQTTNQMLNWWDQYQAPAFSNQQSNLDSKLRSQGITQGSEAWNNAQNLQARNQNDARTSFFLQSEPTAFNQSMQQNLMPSTVLNAIMRGTTPQFQTTPQEQIQPANYSSLAEQNYQQQNSNNQNMVNGIFKTAAAVAPFLL